MPKLIPISYICIDCGKVVCRKRNLRCFVCQSISMKGKRNSLGTEFKKGFIPWNKGISHDAETKQKISESKKGKPWTEKQRESVVNSIPRGENHPNWIHDRTKLAKTQGRNDSSYKEWRRAIWERDAFLCRIGNKECAGHIVAHHILGWASFPGLRYEINNGITLCRAHHPSKRAEEKRLAPIFTELVSVSKV
jgi:hypothetical protein